MASPAILIAVAAALLQPAASPQGAPDPARAAEALTAVAVEQGAFRDFPPIPLDQDGGTAHGVVFDHFRLIARTVRTAATGRTRRDPRSLPADVVRPRTVVLAYPLSCDGRTVSPGAIEIVGAQGTLARRDGEYLRDDALGTLLPGVQAPVSSLAATFLIETLEPAHVVRVTYTDVSCSGGAPELAFPVKFTPPRTLVTPAPPLPAGLAASSTPVRLQALVDLEGLLQHPVYVDGPTHLTGAAIQAVERWRSEPPRINGAPIVRAVLVQVPFKP